MKIFRTTYLFPVFFVGLSIYQLVQGQYLETALYLLAGLAFIFNALASEEKFIKYKKQLVTITWITLGVSVLLFFWVLQFNTP